MAPCTSTSSGSMRCSCSPCCSRRCRLQRWARSRLCRLEGGSRCLRQLCGPPSLCCILEQWSVGWNLRPTSGADLLHDQPGPQAVDVEDVAARKLLRFRALEQGVPTNDAVLVVLDLLICGIGEPPLHVERNPAVSSEAAESLRKLPGNLDHIRHHVDGEARWILNEEGQHENQEKRHGDHVVNEVNVEQTNGLGRPAVVQSQVHHVHGVLAN
mmetsp:Transcript_99564/g.179715  ORF Transcript_99564/g.179715 Transcript_99564/m.179715 type:complete len:213 (-) Transcript_99564:546-1184(-)